VGPDALAAPAPLPPPAGSPPAHAPETVRRAVHEVLSRAEFRRPGPSPLTRARNWVFGQIDRLLSGLNGGGVGSVLGWTIVALLVGAVAYFVWRFARGLTGDPELAASLPPPPRRTAADWLAEASAQEARGEWRLALRSRYRALVADLAGRGLIEDVPGRTAGEYRAEVRTNLPAGAAEFGGASDLFELAWYGNRATGPEEAERFRVLADRLLADRVLAGRTR
jgi:hypothetical protein